MPAVSACGSRSSSLRRPIAPTLLVNSRELRDEVGKLILISMGRWDVQIGRNRSAATSFCFHFCRAIP